MRLRHFADFAEMFQERCVKPLWERYPQRESDAWDALSLFLEGYAFERSGRSPDYGPAAADAIVQAKSNGERLDTGQAHLSVWNCFKDFLGGSKLNEANNPLCPKGTTYKRKPKRKRVSNNEDSTYTNGRKTDSTYTNKESAGESVMEVLCGIPDPGSQHNIVVYAKNGLQGDQLKAVHNRIQKINGIGQKIASLFLRDVASFCNTFPSKDRHLLQPIDIWVRRIAKELDGPVTDPDEQDPIVDKEIGEWIVGESATASVNPEAVNQGMWYFATQIAGSYYRLRESIRDWERARVLCARHERALDREAQAATIMAGIIRKQS